MKFLVSFLLQNEEKRFCMETSSDSSEGSENQIDSKIVSGFCSGGRFSFDYSFQVDCSCFRPNSGNTCVCVGLTLSYTGSINIKMDSGSMNHFICSGFLLGKAGQGVVFEEFDQLSSLLNAD